ncbi:MAG: Gfo/Idh/MocA family oxidoreductase [Gemmatimonadetes bacterium]|nr:Gfo/Idh/MocA family oxidoreductase [Gemmatimonadota bacterium]
MKTEPTRIGVVGVGSLGFHHARLLAGMPGAELVGVFDTRPERLAEVVAQLGVRPSGSLAALLDGVDAVVIAVPTQAHEAVALPALERGVHVLIEKPIAPSLGGADRILAAARATGALVQIGHVERFNAALRACEPYLEQPMFVESHRLAPFAPRGTDVAVVLDLMIHDLDLVLSLMKSPVETISAVGVPVLTSSPDIANARLEFGGGGVANLTASRVSLERMRKIRFFQRSGYISLDLAAGKGEYLRLKPGISAELLAELAAGNAHAGARAVTGTAGGATVALAGASGLLDLVERVSFTGDGAEPLARELTSFLAAVQGTAPVPVTGDDGRRALAVALEIVDRIGRHVAH